MPLPLIVQTVSVNPLLPVHQQVTSLHGQMPGRDGALEWTHSQESAIEYTENNLFSYYVRMNGLTTPLVVARTADGQKFLKARCDAQQPDTLLALPCFKPANTSVNPVPSVPADRLRL
jgi:hypothetical protein